MKRRAYTEGDYNDSIAQVDAGAILDLAEKIGALLRGKGPAVQGAVLAELTSLWICGHHPDMREQAIAAHKVLLDGLVESNDFWPKEEGDHAGRPRTL
jgi:hypothetical protein